MLEKSNSPDIKTVQVLLKNLLTEFHNICEENGLVYNLYGGTFLGAVRHKDIIPWDDDIDVSMPRKDYEKLIQIVGEKYSDRFEIYAYPKENYIYAFGKFCDKGTVLLERPLLKKYSRFALYVDIFPMDGYPDLPPQQIKKRFDKMRFLKKQRCRSVFRIIPSNVWWKKPYSLIRFFEYLPARLRGYKYYLDKEVEESLKYSFEDCDYVSCAVSWHEKGRTLKADYFDRTLYDFGGHKYWGMKNYDKYLSNLYGDYMKLPPENQRVTNHNYELFFIKEN